MINSSTTFQQKERTLLG